VGERQKSGRETEEWERERQREREREHTDKRRAPREPNTAVPSHHASRLTQAAC